MLDANKSWPYKCNTYLINVMSTDLIAFIFYYIFIIFAFISFFQLAVYYYFFSYCFIIISVYLLLSLAVQIGLRGTDTA